MEVIIEEETTSKCTVDEKLPSTSSRFQVFPQLTSLDLFGLQKLKSIYQGIHILEWTTLQDLRVGRCDKVEILFGSSELLNRETNSQQPVFLIDHSKVAFPNLKNLNIQRCEGLRNLTTFSTVESLVKLARMEISHCNMIEEIIQQIGEVKEESPIVFRQLVYLELDNLPKLKHFCVGNFTLEFPYLEQAVVIRCPNMKIFSEGDLLTPNLQKIQLTDNYEGENEERWEGSLNSTIQKMFEEMVGLPGLDKLILSQFPRVKEIWHDQTLPVSFLSNLGVLIVDDCTLMSIAIPANVMRFLSNLYTLEVTNCDSVEVVFQLEELNADQQMFFGLQYLKLINLPKLKRFCNFNGIMFHQLHHLKIENCPNMKAFISNSTQVDITANMESQEMTSEKNFMPNDIQPFFDDEKVGFPNLETIEISGMRELRKICQISGMRELRKIWQISGSFFSRLKKMKIKNCQKLMNIVSSNIEEETSSKCTMDEKLPSVSSRFQMFPQLTSLDLEGLPKLKSIYEGIHILEWTALQDLRVFECDEMKILFGSSELLSGETNSQQPMFLIDHSKVGFPNLETIEISGMRELRKIWHHRFASDSFSKLKNLKIINCQKLMNIFPWNIIVERRLERLEKLQVYCCDSMEVIIEEETTSKCTVDEKLPSTSRFQVFPQLTSLKLWGLQKLKSIYQGIHFLEWTVLEDLEVHRCDKVEILFGFSERLSGETKNQQPVFLIDHSKVTFPNLKNLVIQCCNGLRNLTTFSTVESIVKLARMKIRRCNMIEEIIQQFGEVNEESPIVFSQLIYLELHNLPRFEHFCAGNFTLEFPYLEQAVVSGCSSMKIFSKGDLLTPNLQKMQLTINYEKENEERWEGSLNSTIQKMFEEMDGLRGIDELILSQVPRVKEIWHDQTLPVSFFSNLIILIVDDCTLMSIAIPANLIQFLNRLWRLEVTNCDSVEEVFQLEELNAHQHVRQLFPKLGVLKLINLRKLKRFCSFNGIMFHKLYHLTIENCPNMKAFTSNSIQVDITTDMEPQEMTSEKNFMANDIQPFFDHEKDAFTNLKVLKLSKLPKLEQLVSSSVSFHCLEELVVSKCDRLENLVTISTVKSLVNLIGMKITDCKMMKKIIELQVGEEVKGEPIVFNQLKYLGLDCLSSLSSFYLGNYTLEFPSLEKVIVRECPKMKLFSQGDLSTPKLQRLQLSELEDEGCWEGNLNSTIQKLFEEMNVQSSKDED